MNILVRLGRVADAIITGIGVVVGLVPDPTLPSRKSTARR
jgi:hypothetical protein